ncbi:hypothetical protein [Lacticaseibacillus jixianensis]
MLIPMVVSNVLANQFMVPLNRISEYTKSVIIGACFNIIIELPLIFYYSAMGAAAASVCSEVVVAGIQIYYCREDFEFTRVFESVLGVSIIGLVLFGIATVMNGTIANLFLAAIISVALALLYLLFTFKWLKERINNLIQAS